MTGVAPAPSIAGPAEPRRVIDAIADAVVGVRFRDLPEGVVTTIVDAVTDAVGVGIAGSREPIATALLDGLDVTHTPGKSPLIGVAGSTAATTSALFNGAVIHALDFDDTNHPAYAHPSSHLVPVLLSRLGSVDGARAVCAYAIGLEVEARLGRTLNMGHYLAGWHATGTFGTLAATAAAAMLADLDLAQTRMALAMAASMSSGLRSNFGTMTKPLHAGLAARNGIQATALARAGLTASVNAIDGEFGFLDTLSGGGEYTSLDTSCWQTLGTEWETVSPYGLAIKPFPACGATHPAIEAALAVHDQLGDEPIGNVSVQTTRHSHRILIYPRPRSGLEGKFSMQFCVAAALERGEVGLATFSDAVVEDSRIRDLMERVDVGVHPDLADNTEFAAEVTATSITGRRASSRVELAKGKRARWMSTTELSAKFRDCAESTLGPAGSAAAFKLLQTLPDLADLGRLADAFRP